MEAEAINEGLARYMGWTRDEDPVPGYEWFAPDGQYAAPPVFTDSLDACSLVADKLGVREIQFHQPATDIGCRVSGVGRYGWKYGRGPTRSHAWAAALWAAVRETK